MEEKKTYQKEYEFGFNDGNEYLLNEKKGLNKDIIREISKLKEEPEWMLDLRLKAFDVFIKMENPKWGPDLSFINFDDYIYYSPSKKKMENDWNKVPETIKNTFKKLGIPEAEAKFLNGVSTQYDSETVYKSLRKELEDQGVIFSNIETALKLYPEIVKKYFGKLVSYADNKYAALNTSIWSGGSFIYIPNGVKVEKPLQAYFRINGLSLGQFERTLIILESNALLHYVEGCTAPIYNENNLHAAVVEVFVGEDSSCRYTTIQNWSKNVLNLVTKRAKTLKRGNMSWIDGNIGSGINMKYPCTILEGDYSTSDCISIAIASKDVVQDSGAKMIHIGRDTKSKIISKSISLDGGDTRYRGLVEIKKNAINSFAHVECDTLILDSISRSDTVPIEKIYNSESYLEHEAKISAISDEQIFYFTSKGLTKKEAEYLIILGFIEPFVKELPMEYAIELNRLIKLDMEGSVG